MEEESIARIVVQDFLRRHGAVELSNTDGIEPWLLADGTIIQLPTGFSRIDMDHFMDIATDQVRASPWEFDSWI